MSTNIPGANLLEAQRGPCRSACSYVRSWRMTRRNAFDPLREMLDEPLHAEGDPEAEVGFRAFVLYAVTVPVVAALLSDVHLALSYL